MGRRSLIYACQESTQHLGGPIYRQYHRHALKSLTSNRLTTVAVIPTNALLKICLVLSSSPLPLCLRKCLTGNATYLVQGAHMQLKGVMHWLQAASIALVYPLARNNGAF
jgi:hypothetical protein